MAEMTVKQKRAFLASLQAKRDRAWREIEGAQELVQGIARHGVDGPEDERLAQELAAIVSLELFVRQSVRLRIERGELDQVADD